MNELKNLMPERFSTLDNNMSLEKILRAKDSKEPIVGKVVMWHSNSKCFDVDLGNGLYGILPVSNASIYPSLSSEEHLTASLRAIIGKPIIVTVISVNNTNNSVPIITLSRKELMLNAFNNISNSIGKAVDCCVISFSKFGVFVDVGNGISGLIHYKDLCISRVNDFSELGFNVGDKISAKIISVDDNFHVNLNYMDQFDNLALTLKEDDMIIVTTLKQHNYDGYFVYINPNTPALMTVPQSIDINYGDKVVAKVKGQRSNNPNQLKLTFVSFV